MSLSAYEIVVPTLLHGTRVLTEYLHLAREHEHAQRLPQGSLLQARLAPDMLTLGEQFGIVCNKVELNLSRLMGRDPPQAHPIALDYDELGTRLAAVHSMLASVRPEELSGTETRPYELHHPLAHGWLRGDDLLRQLVLPDFFFHIATVHGILRHNGLAIGKKDYLGSLALQSTGYS